MHSKTQGRQWSVRCMKRGIDYHLFDLGMQRAAAGVRLGINTEVSRFKLVLAIRSS